MRILVANLGSTSFKFTLLSLSSQEECELARGGMDRIGSDAAEWSIRVGDQSSEGISPAKDHAAALELMLSQLKTLGGDDIATIDAIGFKAVHGGPISGAVRVTEDVLTTMDTFSAVAPAHNPPYIKAMRDLAEMFPSVPQVAAFETAYHQSIPLYRQVYGTPYEWVERYGIRRYGFHGATHSWAASRIQSLVPGGKRHINCHLGGSSSLCAILDGKSQATSMGLTPQGGLPQSARVGDFDAYGLHMLAAHGIDWKEALHTLGKEGGLLGLSGVSCDFRDLHTEADKGNTRARLALDAFTDSVIQLIGAYTAVLHGVDAISFTGGVSQYQPRIRANALAPFAYLGVQLDNDANQAASGKEETCISSPDSKVQVWILPTDEERMVARQTLRVLQS